MTSEYAKVLVHLPIGDGLFDYLVQPALRGKVQRGCMVVVPFNQDLVQGVVFGAGAPLQGKKIRPIHQLIDETPVLTEAQLQLAEILSQRTLASLNDCVNTFLTEKIRRISRMIYKKKPQFPDQPVGQQSFFRDGASGTTREALLHLFQLHDAPLTAKEIDAALGNRSWKKSLNELVRAGWVLRELEIDAAETQPKFQSALRLTADAEAIARHWDTLSRIKEVQERRQALLTRLQVESPLSLAEVCAEIGATRYARADALALQKLGLAELTRVEVWRDYDAIPTNDYPSETIQLTPEQQQAVDYVQQEFPQSEKTPILIQGVTGSGKTEIYLRAAALALAAGRQVLMLVPEIALTPQMTSRFESRFPGQVGVYHSRLSDGQRFDTWRRGRDGQFRIIIGPRSALSVPLFDLGLILVDECHDDSYYQTDQSPYFSAVQAVADYARLNNALLILGSATPTIAQMYKAKQSHWRIVRLKNRASGVAKPAVRLVDMRQELKAGNRQIFSRLLLDELQKTLTMRKQAILFLNRRGSAGYTFCHFCGHDFRCPRCDIPLTWHQSIHQLQCHFCGFAEELPTVCPECGRQEIRQFGTGIEQVERFIHAEFPQSQVLRMDSETTAGKGAYEKILTRFGNQEVDILLGTQMVTKGLDFPGVRLVGAVLADVGTNFHDYRVDEHTYQLLTQVSGRAGRTDAQGIAILQTFQPGRYSIQAALNSEYDEFYEREIRYRRLIGYPPFMRLVRLLVSDPDERQAETRIFQLADHLSLKIRSMKKKAIHLIGPAPCFFPRINGRYRWHLILRGANPVELLRAVDPGEFDLRGCKVEVDPPSVL